MSQAMGHEPDLAQLRKGLVQYCLLALLEKDERYGYDLARRLTRPPGIVASEGTIYPLLSRLLKAGLVSARWEHTENERPRRYYKATAAGHELLDAFRAQWKPFLAAVQELVKEEGGL
jgi:PadR family transcriptional regulator PadR